MYKLGWFCQSGSHALCCPPCSILLLLQVLLVLLLLLLLLLLLPSLESLQLDLQLLVLGAKTRMFLGSVLRVHVNHGQV